MTMISDAISRMGRKSDETLEQTLAAQLEAFTPDQNNPLEFSSLVSRNAGQVGRLITDANQRLTEINAVIDAATALRGEISTSLAAWEAAAAVLDAPTKELAAKIETAAAETRKASGKVKTSEPEQSDDPRLPQTEAGVIK